MWLLLLLACNERGPYGPNSEDNPWRCKVDERAIDLDTSVAGGPTANEVFSRLEGTLTVGAPEWPTLDLILDRDEARVTHHMMSSRCDEDAVDLLGASVPVDVLAPEEGLLPRQANILVRYVEPDGTIHGTMGFEWIGDGEFPNWVDERAREVEPRLGERLDLQLYFEWPSQLFTVTARYLDPDSPDDPTVPYWVSTANGVDLSETFEIE